MRCLAAGSRLWQTKKMLDIPGQPVLNKLALIGGCARLPVRVDGTQLLAEVGQLPPAIWASSGGRVGVHAAAQAVFLRGFAPAEGDKPIDDRPILAQLPYVSWIISTLIAAPAQRCLLARVAAGGSIAPHVDRAPYFSKTIRIHVPVETHEGAYMLCGGQCYVMRRDEVWALNNSAEHAVWNAHPTLSRTHLICDFLPSSRLLELLGSSDRALAREQPEVRQHFARLQDRAALSP